MRDKELYEAILEVERPWRVIGVELDTAGREVRVEIENTEKQLPCPACGVECPRHDSRHRRWRHLDTCQFQTILMAAVPRVKCPKHGVLQVPVPWAERNSHFTALFEQLVISWLQEASISAVATLFGLSWNATDRIMREAVRRGLKRQQRRLPRHLGIDETSFQKRHEYVTVLCAQDEGHVVHVADGRSAEAVEVSVSDFDEEARSAVETVAIWQAYINAVEKLIPGAEKKICFDKFHMAQHLGKAVDKVRREEHRRLKREDDDTLKGSKHLWLTHPANLTDERLEQIETLRRVAEKTGRAWVLKETAMDAWRYRSRHWARTALLRWHNWAIRSQLEPMRQVARMVKRRLDGLLVNAIHHGHQRPRRRRQRPHPVDQVHWSRLPHPRALSPSHRATYFHLGGLNMNPETIEPIVFHTS